jgi:Tfp pilus assembly protein PilF
VQNLNGSGEALRTSGMKESPGRGVNDVKLRGVVPLSAARFVGVLALSLCIAENPAAKAQNANDAVESPAVRQLRQALELERHGNPQGAMSIANKLLEANPHFVPALKLKGMLLSDVGEESAAGPVFEEALELAPNDSDLLLETGIYKLATGDKAGAIRLLEHCIRIVPEDGDAQFYLAQAYHLNGQDQQAMRAIRQSVKIEPDNPGVLQKYGELLCSTGDCQAALEWLTKADTLDPSLPGIDYDLGKTDHELMDLAGAADNLSRAVNKDPKDMNSLALLADTEVRLSSWQPAEDDYRRYLSHKQDDAAAVLGLGHCELELKDYDAAIDTLHLALKLDPEKFLAHFYLSRAYAATGKTEEAEHEAALHHLMMQQATFVTSAVSEERESTIVPEAQRLLAGHREEDALKLYQEHFEGTSITLADSYVFVGKIELYSGNAEAGLRNLHHALEIDPRVRGAHTYEGILALKLGDLNRAENQFKAELANDPNYQTAIAEMGEVRYHQENWQEAASYLEKSKTMTPELIYMLCDSYFHLKRLSDADLEAETAAVYGRNDPRFMQDLVDLLRRNQQSELAAGLSANMTH